MERLFPSKCYFAFVDNKKTNSLTLKLVQDFLLIVKMQTYVIYLAALLFYNHHTKTPL